MRRLSARWSTSTTATSSGASAVMAARQGRQPGDHPRWHLGSPGVYPVGHTFDRTFLGAKGGRLHPPRRRPHHQGSRLPSQHRHTDQCTATHSVGHCGHRRRQPRSGDVAAPPAPTLPSTMFQYPRWGSLDHPRTCACGDAIRGGCLSMTHFATRVTRHGQCPHPPVTGCGSRLSRGFPDRGVAWRFGLWPDNSHGVDIDCQQAPRRSHDNPDNPHAPCSQQPSRSRNAMVTGRICPTASAMR